MAIIKNFKQDFTITPNVIVNDPRLTLKAVGLWTYLNSKPTTWNFSVKGTTSQKKDGRDSVTSGMKELETCGYLKRIPRQNNDGKWDGYDYQIFDQPNTGKSVDGKSVDVKPVEHSKTILSNKELSKKEGSSDLFSKEPIESISKTILKFLNEKKPGDRPFKFTPSNLSLIETRIKEGFKLEDFKKVISFKVSEWKDDEKMKQYIRPATLFGTKFDQYVVQSANGSSSSNGSQNFQYNPQQNADLI